MLKPLFLSICFTKYSLGYIQKKTWADSPNQPMLKTFNAHPLLYQ